MKGDGGLLRGAGRAFIPRALGLAAGYALGLVLGRALGTSGSGAFVFAIATTGLFSMVGRLGVDGLVLQRAATAQAASDWALLRSTWRDGVFLSLAGSALLAALLFAGAEPCARYFGASDLGPALRLASLAVPAVSLYLVAGEMLRGLHRVAASQVVQSAAPRGLLLLLVLVLGWVFGFSTSTALLAYVLASFASAALGLFFWRRATPMLREGAFEQSARANRAAGGARALARDAVPFFGVSALSLVLPWIPVAALALMRSEHDVGVFAAAYRTALLTSLLLLPLETAAAPRFAALHARGDTPGLAAELRRTSVWMIAASVPLVVILCAFPGPALALFGAGFEAGAGALRILVAGQFVNAATGAVALLLLMCGRERLLRVNLLASALLSLVLHVALVPRFGAAGAALATSAALAATNLVAAIQALAALREDARGGPAACSDPRPGA